VPAALSHTSLTLHAVAGSLARTLGVMERSLSPFDPEALCPPLWEVGWVRGIERHTLRERLGAPHLVETDTTRTFGGEEDWWAFKTAEDKVIAVCLRVPYQDAVLCTSSTSQQDIHLAASTLAPWSVDFFEKPRPR
jgi:hypothetical protein